MAVMSMLTPDFACESLHSSDRTPPTKSLADSTSFYTLARLACQFSTAHPCGQNCSARVYQVQLQMGRPWLRRETSTRDAVALPVQFEGCGCQRPTASQGRTGWERTTRESGGPGYQSNQGCRTCNRCRSGCGLTLHCRRGLAGPITVLPSGSHAPCSFFSLFDRISGG